MPRLPSSQIRPKSARAHMSRRGVRGFTLLEVVLAFSILAIGMTIAMQVASSAMRQAQQAAAHTQAALYAQNLLDSAGLDEALEPGETSGDFESGFSWRLSVQEYEPVSEALPLLLDGLSSPIQLLELDLTVEWERGSRRHEANFRTLRAVLPELMR